MDEYTEIDIMGFRFAIPTPSPGLTREAKRRHDAAIFNDIIMPTLRANARSKFVRQINAIRQAGK